MNDEKTSTQTTEDLVSRAYAELAVDLAVKAERDRCTAWAKMYWDGDLASDYEMYVGIRNGKEPPK